MNTRAIAPQSVAPIHMVRPGGLLLVIGGSVIMIRSIYLAATGGGQLGATGKFIPRLLLYLELASSSVVTIAGFVKWVWRPLFSPKFAAGEHNPVMEKQALNKGKRRATLVNGLLSLRVITSAAVVAAIAHVVRLALFLFLLRQ